MPVVKRLPCTRIVEPFRREPCGQRGYRYARGSSGQVLAWHLGQLIVSHGALHLEVRSNRPPSHRLTPRHGVHAAGRSMALQAIWLTGIRGARPQRPGEGANRPVWGYGGVVGA